MSYITQKICKLTKSGSQLSQNFSKAWESTTASNRPPLATITHILIPPSKHNLRAMKPLAIINYRDTLISALFCQFVPQSSKVRGDLKYPYKKQLNSYYCSKSFWKTLTSYK